MKLVLFFFVGFFSLSASAQEPAGSHGGTGLIARQASLAGKIESQSEDMRLVMETLIAENSSAIALEREGIDEISKKLALTNNKEGAGYIVVSAAALSIIATLTAAGRAKPYKGKIAYLTSSGILSTVAAAGGGYQIYLTRTERKELTEAIAKAKLRIDEKEKMLASLKNRFDERYNSQK